MARVQHLAAVCALVLLTACGTNESAGEPPEQVLPKIDTLSKLSSRICECNLAGRNIEVLESEYARLTKGLKQQKPEYTASTPIQFSQVCYPELGSDACVASPPTTSSGSFVCTSAQAAVAEKAWNDALNRGDDADAALENTIRQIRMDAAASSPQTSCERV